MDRRAFLQAVGGLFAAGLAQQVPATVADPRPRPRATDPRIIPVKLLHFNYWSDPIVWPGTLADFAHFTPVQVKHHCDFKTAGLLDIRDVAGARIRLELELTDGTDVCNIAMNGVVERYSILKEQNQTEVCMRVIYAPDLRPHTIIRANERLC
jgi:hypothetical protein